MNVFKVLSVLILVCTSTNVVFSQIGAKIESFNRVEIFGRLNVRLDKSSNDSIFIRSSQFDVNNVNYSVEDSVLKIKLLSDLPKSNKVNITIQFQNIQSLRVGAGVIIYNTGTIESDFLKISAKSGSEVELLLNVDTLDIKVIENSFIRLAGINKFINLKTSTKGDFMSLDMVSNSANVVLNGGSAEINVVDFLDATVRNGASLKYVKQPKNIKKKLKFGGTIGIVEKY